jgi:hypothetical protein
VDNIPIGVDFVDYLHQAVGRCDVLLAIIGDHWLDAVEGEDGQPRLQDPNDYVRAEIQAALVRDIPVIPVLVDGASMPKQADLPDAIAAISRRNAIEVRPGRGFEHGLEALLRGLDHWIEQLDANRVAERELSFIARNWIAALVSLVAAGVAGSMLLSAVSIPYNNAVIAGVPAANTGLLNACMYGLAIMAGIYASGGMWLTISRYRPGEAMEDYDARQFMQAALGLPFHIPLLVFVLWLGSGMIIPAFLAITEPEAGISVRHFLQFFAVQAFLGAIAAAITFCLLAELILCFLYPAYATKSVPDACRRLESLDRLVPIVTAILFGLPIPTFLVLCAIALVRGTQPQHDWQMWWLAVPAMLVSTALSFWISCGRLPGVRKRLHELEAESS